MAAVFVGVVEIGVVGRTTNSSYRLFRTDEWTGLKLQLAISEVLEEKQSDR